jgi:CHAT domain-containing protein
MFRIRGERADNLEIAITHFEAALAVYTRENVPDTWAAIQGNLGYVYGNRIRGVRADNLKRAIAYHEAALTVRTLQALPRDHLIAARALGQALLQSADWEGAGKAYASGREAFTLLFGQGLEEVESRDLVTAAGPMFAEAAFAAIQRGDLEMALSLVSEGKARLLAVALRQVGLELPVDKHNRLDELRAAVREQERALEANEGMARANALNQLAALRQEVLDIIKSANPGEAGPSSTLARVRRVLPAGGALLVPLVTKFGCKILMVSEGPQGLLAVIDLPELTSEKLDELIRGERKDGKSGGWLGAYNINYVIDETEKEQRWPEWTSAIQDLGPALWRLGGNRLYAALKEHGVKPGARLIWMPTGALGILPVGLAQDPVSKQRIGEEYEVIYAPSLEALAAAQALIAKQAPASLAAIINPTGDLAGTEKEGAFVASHFASSARTILKNRAATPNAVLAALRGRTYWHFATHGEFSWQDARGSALIMNGRVPLTVGLLSETDGLGRPRLVVLSACETGLYDIDHDPEEFVGLPGAFAALGAAGVLATLWPVSDDATALLMAKFYELHKDLGLPPPTALSRAQAWLREASNEDLTEYATVAMRQGRIERRHLTEIQTSLSAEGLKRSRNRALVQWLKRENPGDKKGSREETQSDMTSSARPYADPYYWAGFIFTGY